MLLQRWAETRFAAPSSAPVTRSDVCKCRVEIWLFGLSVAPVQPVSEKEAADVRRMEWKVYFSSRSPLFVPS